MYGTISAFASDVLRQEFEKVDVRGSRRPDAIVVDEIDFMILDRGVEVYSIIYNPTLKTKS